MLRHFKRIDIGIYMLQQQFCRSVASKKDWRCPQPCGVTSWLVYAMGAVHAMQCQILICSNYDGLVVLGPELGPSECSTLYKF